MADNAESRRARELLKSSDKLLEKTRNRPRYESSWLDRLNDERRSSAVIHKTRENAMVGRQAPRPAASKAEFDALREAMVDRLGLALGKIESLQRRIADLEKQVASDTVIEWPLRGR